MTPLEAAAWAILECRKQDPNCGITEDARAAISAYMKACAEDEAIATRIAEAADDEMARQTEDRLHVGPNYSAVGRAAISALEPKE